MTGWRIGWLVAPEALVRPIEPLTQNLYISPPAISQEAALGAFDGIEELEAIKEGYARNRAMLLEELPRAGLASILPADGAFYLCVEVTRFTDDSEVLAKSTLGAIGVAITPGIDFDPEHGRDYVRFSYAGGESEMREAVRRIKSWLKEKKGSAARALPLDAIAATSPGAGARRVARAPLAGSPRAALQVPLSPTQPH
jgi:aspartate/methionine/tyrosine aminotransferase